MNFEPGPDGVVRISFEIADLKTWVQIPVGALDLIFFPTVCAASSPELTSSCPSAISSKPTMDQFMPQW